MNHSGGVKEIETSYGRVPGPRSKGKRIVVVAYPQVDLLDLTGPVEVFHLANLAVNSITPGSGFAYDVHLVSTSDELAIESGSGVSLQAHSLLANYRSRVDTLLVPGGETWHLLDHQRVLTRIQRISTRARRTASVCSGALLLAACGLLNGGRATTHWRACEYLRDGFPDVEVQQDAIFVKDDSVYTSAGSTAGIDLMLHLVEEDHGRDVAMHVARDMVMFLKRPGGQSQFSKTLDSQSNAPAGWSDLLAWIANNLAADLRVEVLAERCHMSVRSFVRRFPKEVGVTPARYVETIRVEAARQRLEEGQESLAQIAAECGFGSSDSMRRSFQRVLGVSPGNYRTAFGERHSV